MSRRIEVEVDGLRAWVYPREKRSGGVVWYCDVADPSGRRRYAATKSLKTSSKTRAIDAAKRLLRSRQVLAADGGIEYLSDYWDPAVSRKMKALKASGRLPSRQHMDAMRHYIDTHVLPWLRSQGVHRLTGITYAVAQDLINHLSDKFASGTIPGVRTAISQPLQQAVREQVIPSNPMRETEAPRRPKARREHIEWPKLQKILKPGLWSSQKAYVASLLSLSTGMRSGELRALQWRYVDTENGLVDVVHSWDNYNGRLKPPKNGNPRYGLRLPALVAAELHKLRPADADADHLVFCRDTDRHKPVAVNHFLYHLRQAAKRAGEPLSELQTFHSLRHSAVSYGLAGAQDRARREALLQMAGHADEGIQGVYRHTTEAELDAIAAEWDKRFQSIG